MRCLSSSISDWLHSSTLGALLLDEILPVRTDDAKDMAVGGGPLRGDFFRSKRRRPDSNAGGWGQMPDKSHSYGCVGQS
jgi:hypothetical protein